MLMVCLPDFDYERFLFPPSTRYLLGIDEVGRGPWAGPVTIGAFLLDLKNFNPQEFINLGVRDSKKATVKNRTKIFSYFQNQNFTFQVASASSDKIDEKGISNTIKGLILYTLNHFRGRFDYCLVDGNYDFISESSVKSVVKADSSCFSVAAASICAKVIRDQRMDEFDNLYPGYDFSQNKGYGTAFHLSALQKLGICPIHRKSYKPIKSLL